MSSSVTAEAVASGAVSDPTKFDVRDDAVLDDLVATLNIPRPYSQVEAVEAWIKNSWASLGIESLDEKSRARFSEFFLRIGFLPKYKSYGVKYAAPFGYSLFDLENGGGFSIQLHETAKVEAFHVLGTHPDSFILLCSAAAWEAQGADMVAQWKAGRPEDSSLAYRPEPGDVAVIEDLSTVHTVIGCIVEEFATSSYDVVKRLYDQNESRTVALPSSHKQLAAVLAEADVLSPKRRVERNDEEWTFANIAPGNADITRLPEMGLIGRHVSLDGSSSLAETVPSDYVSTVFVLDGSVQLEVDGTKFALGAGDTTAIAPGSNYRLSTESNARLSLCEVLLEYGFADLR